MASEFPRVLKSDERAVLNRILAKDFAGAAELRAQAAVATVVSMCDCGCPSVHFAVPVDAPRAHVPGSVWPHELGVRDAEEGGAGTIMLFLASGTLQQLEYISLDASHWPAMERLID